MRLQLALAVCLITGTQVLWAAEGEELYQRHCGSCHDRGAEHPGTARLAERWPEEASLLDRKQLPAVLVRTIVRQGLNLMPPFRPGEISDAELDSLATYLEAGPYPATEGDKDK